MKHLLVLIALFAAFAPFPASACSCAPPGNVEQEKAQSTRVFLGRVTSTEERTPQMDQGWWAVAIDWVKQLFGASPSYNITDFAYRRIAFSVTQSFKGQPESTLRVTTGMGGGDCGYPFERGKDYVVYAHGKEGALGAGICSLTGLATNPRSGLAILRDG